MRVISNEYGIYVSTNMFLQCKLILLAINLSIEHFRKPQNNLQHMTTQFIFFGNPLTWLTM